MDRGTYASASAGFYNLRKLEVVNNNLANVNTPGFKKQMLVGEVQTFDQTLASKLQDEEPYAEGDHQRTPGVTQVRTVTDFTQGPIKNTGNPLDVALRHPNDFFAVQTPEGIHYTRAGNFTLDPTGNLITQEGYQVLGNAGPISAGDPGVRIEPGGRVTANGQEVAFIGVFRMEDPTLLERVGAGRFRVPTGAPAPVPQDEPMIEPESLEMSNVSAITSMVDMITASRGFEAYTKSAQTIDEMNNTAISRLGRSR